ncbi:MAG: ORF6N domain-containing protein [Dysgonamonadaceae bacterium]|jgi:phage regulator Rha-like protein|nr:ORF6N domain-containing protein [Dysgonamonadaceae bacterium]
MEENVVRFNQVEEKILTIRNQSVILDSDVAVLYGVETKRVNEAIKNNPDKFPNGYVFELEKQEVISLRSKFSTTNLSVMTRVAPKAFTKKGCYMLATILKSPKATQTTIDIIEAFEKMQEMSMSIVELMKDHENEQKQKTLMQKGEELFGDIIGNALDTVDTETSFELNLAAFKIKHTVKRRRK